MNESADSLTWLAEHQRARCDGASALTTFQEVVVDEIAVPQSALDAADPKALVRAVSAFSDAMQTYAMLLPGEYAQEAYWSTQVEYYCAQVRDGGHVQYAANSKWAPIPVRCCEFGLKSMVADPYRDVLKHFIRLKQADARTGKKLALAGGFRSVGAAIADLDARFAELERSEPLAPRHRTWLKSQRKLKAVPDGELRDYVNAIASANRLRSERQIEAERARVAHEASDPAFQSVKALCEMASLRLKALGQEALTTVRSVWPEGPEGRGYALGAVTDRGQRTALFFAGGGLFKKYRAVLLEAGQALPLADLTLSRQDFEALVPADLRSK